MKQVLSAYTIKNEIHIGLSIRYTVRDKITSFFRYGVTKGTSETEMYSFYLLFLVQIIILLRLANTMVEPRRLNSATSWIKTNIIWQEREVYKWKWNIGPMNPNGLQWMVKITCRTNNLRIDISPACKASSSSSAPFYKELDHTAVPMEMTAICKCT